MLNLLLNFIEEIGVDHSFIPCCIGLLLEIIDLSDFFIILMQYLFDIILNLLNLFLKIIRLKLFFISLNCLHLVHLSFE